MRLYRANDVTLVNPRPIILDLDTIVVAWEDSGRTCVQTGSGMRFYVGAPLEEFVKAWKWQVGHGKDSEAGS